MTKKRTPPDQTKHGGEAAIKRLQHGQPFEGLALETQAAVLDEYEQDGRPALVERQAIRLETASRLFWNAICKAAQDNDFASLDKYVARYGWLAGKSLSAWEYVRKEEAAAPGITAAQVLDVVRGDTDNE